jgi:aldose 1-epimerase
MSVYTNEPGIQFYCGNFLKGKEIGKKNKQYNYRSALCLETQHFPDSPNHPEFPTVVLRPGEIYTSACVYKFSVKY